MKLSNIQLAVCTLALVSSTAFAQRMGATANDNNVYAEIGYQGLSVKNETNETTKPYAARIVIGTELTPDLGLELMTGSTTSKDDKYGYESKTSYYGLMLKPQASISDKMSVFARAGFVKASITSSAAAAYETSDWAYGVGISSKISDKAYVSMDYMSYFNKNSISVKGLTFSIGTKF